MNQPPTDEVRPGELPPVLDEPDNPYTVSYQEPLPSSLRSTSVAALVTVVLILIVATTLLLPGLGIFMAIILMPPLIRTVLVVAKRVRQYRSVSTAEQFLLFLGSFGVTLVTGIVVSVSAFGTFCFVCLGIGDERAVPFAALVALVVASLVFVPIGFFIRARWKMDTRPPEMKEQH